MNVSLTPKLEQFVEKKVKAGSYQTASEVVREGLRLLLERDQREAAGLAELRSLIDVGMEQIQAGRTKPFSDATLKRIRQKGRQKLAAMRRQDG
jgi:antitoxin ParD1/3/4